MGDAAQGGGGGVGNGAAAGVGVGVGRRARHDDAGHARQEPGHRARRAPRGRSSPARAASRRWPPTAASARAAAASSPRPRGARAARPSCRAAPASARRAVRPSPAADAGPAGHEPARRLDGVPHLQRPPRLLRGVQRHPLPELRLPPPGHRTQAGAELLGEAEGQGRRGGRGRPHRPARGARGAHPALLRALLPADRSRLSVAGRPAATGARRRRVPVDDAGRRRPRGRSARDRDPDRLDAGLGRRSAAGPQRGDVVRDLLGGPPRPEIPLAQRVAILLAPARPPPPPAARPTVQFLDRYVEKSFPAADLPGLGLHSPRRPHPGAARVALPA